MNEADLAAIEARLAAITQGPWQYDGMHNEITTPEGDTYFLIISEVRRTPDESTDRFGHYFDANFDFIAHAPDDMRRLIAALVERRKREESL
jgi:hypothetical protein